MSSNIDKIIYRGLWRIEEPFKITKSDLESRPVYLSREDRIQAHFLICFIALVIARILQHRVGNRYSVSKILESLGNVCCSHVQENCYLFDYRDEVTDAIGEALNIDFNKKFMQLGEIKKILGDVKKVKSHYDNLTKTKSPKHSAFNVLRAVFILFYCQSQVVSRGKASDGENDFKK